jgi:hypothetical protein
MSTTPSAPYSALPFTAMLSSLKARFGFNNVCAVCKEIDIYNLLCTENRAPWVDEPALPAVNLISNIRLQTACPFCRLLEKVISNDKNADILKPAVEYVFIEPCRNEYALCGINFANNYFEYMTASCLQIKTPDAVFQDKIVLVSAPVGGKGDIRDLFSKPERVSSYVNFKKVKGWFETCDSQHKPCKPQTVTVDDPIWKYKQRVINVHTREIVPIDLSKIRYATLSYVWGSDFSRLVSSSDWHESLRSQKLPNALPNTFSDILIICKQLDIHYVWIDACCIDQEDSADKQVQVKHMDAIYIGSHHTIVPIEGKSPDSGIPGISSLRSHPYYGKPFKCGGLELAILPGFSVSTKDWNTRAWTLQEALLSPRLLLFNEHYVSFYCNGGAMREDLSHFTESLAAPGFAWDSISVKEPHSGSPFTCNFRLGGFTLGKYGDLANLYCSRDLSYPMDALNALSGLLSHWSRLEDIDFVCGLPKPILCDAMIWFASDYVSRGHPSMPTWSWVAWKGDISYPFQVTYTDFGSLTTKAYKDWFDREFSHGARCLEMRTVGVLEPAYRFPFTPTQRIELGPYIDVLQQNLSKSKLSIRSYVAHFNLTLITKDLYPGWHSASGTLYRSPFPEVPENL